MGALLSSSATPCSLSLVISRILSSLFLDWRHTVSSKFCDTQVPSISLCLCSLVMLTVFSRLRCNGLSLLLGSYLSRIGRIENPSCSPCEHSPRTPLISLCTVQLRTLCATRSFATLSLSWGVAWLLGLHGVPPYPIPQKGSSNQEQQQGSAREIAYVMMSAAHLLVLVLRLQFEHLRGLKEQYFLP